MPEIIEEIKSHPVIDAITSMNIVNAVQQIINYEGPLNQPKLKITMLFQTRKAVDELILVHNVEHHLNQPALYKQLKDIGNKDNKNWELWEIKFNW